ncbi:hypothetical protein Goshw_009288, partial [Gossypium schwendimanii]|nr:hypothetical protein [Gossypium schwendimanii]
MIAFSKKSSALTISCRFISFPSTPFNQDFVAIFLLNPDLLSSLPLGNVGVKSGLGDCDFPILILATIPDANLELLISKAASNCID